MKSILMSCSPEECTEIRNGNISALIRKTFPKELPVKVYIYKSKHKSRHKIINSVLDSVYDGGKVIGEFICKNITEIIPYFSNNYVVQYIHSYPYSEKHSDIDFYNLRKYLGDKKGYDWHISDLKLYETSKDISDFCTFEFKHLGYSSSICGNHKCKNYIESKNYEEPPECKMPNGNCKLQNPPTSWRYVNISL